MHDKVRPTKDQRCKPDVLVMYDNTKGGTDVKDLVSINCSTRMKHRCWLIKTLAFLLDIVRTNSKIILAECQHRVKLSTYNFTYQLRKSLVLPAQVI